MKNNTLMYIALAGAALLLLSKKNNTEVAGIGVSDKLRNIYYDLSEDLRNKVDMGVNFFTLSYYEIDEIVSLMKQYGYRRTYDNGKSPARHCWDMLIRNANKF